MTKFLKQFIYSLLILAIAGSPVQSAMALTFDQSGEPMLMDCHQASMLPVGGDNQDVIKCAHFNQQESCINHSYSCCAAQFSTSFLQGSGTYYFSILFTSELIFSTDNEAIITRYPDQIIRPPKI